MARPNGDAALRNSRRNRSARDAEQVTASKSPAPRERIVARWRATACDAVHAPQAAPEVPARSAGRLRAVAACLLLAASLLLNTTTAHAVGVNETKSEMLWNIAKFVQWPEASLANSKGQIVFTILGEDDLAVELATLLSAKTINGKPVFVRFARRPQDAHGSQILYVASSETQHMDQVLMEVAGAPVLTVADTPAFAANGGMVGFAQDSGKVRFEINLVHAERSGLRISAKLLALARVVDGGN
jgi:YfiR/HmsC-like